MLSVFKKEIGAFFSSLTGYLAIAIFLIVSGLFLWVFPESSILDYQYASLESFFTLAPWVLIFLIPAITMKSLSEEFNSGTIEFLLTKPLSDWQIILGKYFACLVLVAFAILPTLVYYYSVYQLGVEVGNIDTGATNGSYIGLLFLSGVFVAIGLFASSISNSQIVAFIFAVFLSFFFYAAFDSLSQLGIFYAKMDYILQNLGVAFHYNSISRGVIDSRDIIYFLSVISIFIMLTYIVLQNRKS